MKKRYLFLGGVLGPILYLVNDVLGGIITTEFNYIKNTVSELTQSGSFDSYPYGVFILFLSALMGLLLGVGICTHFSFKKSKLLYLGGLLIAISGVLTMMTGTIFPMDPTGADSTIFGVMHGVLVGLSALLALPAMLMIGIGLRRQDISRWFRVFSIVVAIIMLIGGAVSPIIIAQGIEALGLAERVSVYIYQLWSIILGLTLFKYFKSK